MATSAANQLLLKTNRFVGLYCALVIFAMNMGALGIIGVAVQFVLKDTLKLPAQQVATFGLLTDVPYWFGFAFGLFRDRWRPAKLGDRAYFLICAPGLMASFVFLGFAPKTYSSMVLGMGGLAVFGVLLGAAARGLVASVAKVHGMSGRLSSITLVMTSLALMVSTSLGGMVGEATQKTMPGAPFFLSALAALPVLALGLWRPKAIYDVEQELVERSIPEGVWQGIKRLAGHREVYVPAIAILLWSFAPGWGTPLMFYLTKSVKLSESEYGNSLSFMRGGTMLMTLSYAGLCLRFRLRPLFLWGTILGILGGAIFLLIHTTIQAYVVAFVAGGSCGIAVGAYMDLLMRTCPRDLEGAAVMLYIASSTVAGDFSDVFGSWLYDRGGFNLALLATVITTSLILLLLPFVSKSKSDIPEGQPIPDEEAAMEPVAVPA